MNFLESIVLLLFATAMINHLIDRLSIDQDLKYQHSSHYRHLSTSLFAGSFTKQKSGLLSGSQGRYFELDDNHRLHYYTDSSKADEKGEIDVSNVKNVAVSRDTTGWWSTTFTAPKVGETGSPKVWTLSSEFEETARNLADALKTNAKNSNNVVNTDELNKKQNNDAMKENQRQFLSAKADDADIKTIIVYIFQETGGIYGRIKIKATGEEGTESFPQEINNELWPRYNLAVDDEDWWTSKLTPTNGWVQATENGKVETVTTGQVTRHIFKRST